MAIKLLDLGAGLVMVGAIIPNLIFLKISNQLLVYVEIWANITVAIAAGCLIFANYTYWLDEKSIGKMAHPLHVASSVVAIIAGTTMIINGINSGIVPFFLSVAGNSIDLLYSIGALELVMPVGPLIGMIGGIIAVKICSEQLKLALTELRKMEA